MKFNNKTYDILKWICLIFLPALAVLYSAIDGVFGWGHTAAVATILGAIEVFIGSMIGISTKTYNDEMNNKCCFEDEAALYSVMPNEGSSTC